ncbi:MAG: DUF3160 domain-containing protein, partial [Thermoguttaceae bacterium]
KDLPGPAHGYDWKGAARKEGLSPREIERLGKDKILVTDQAFKQVFWPYLSESDVPLFITSDSLLNGFHVLYEESILRLEQTNARKLSGILKFIWANLEPADKIFTGKPQVVLAAKLRAQMVIATALQLLGEKVDGDARVAAFVKEEVARVEAARGQLKPKWLGPPDRGFMALDYARYKPRGFYTKTPALARYFRAVSWLQSIPFRVNKDEELVAILMLVNCVTDHRSENGPERGRVFHDMFRGFDAILGPGDDWNLLAFASHTLDSLGLDGNARFDLEIKEWWPASVRDKFVEQAARDGEAAKINDQLAFVPDDPALPAELSLRVIPARRTPDAVLFGRSTDLRKFQRDFPDGLELCAALGSPFARSRLAAQREGKLIEEIDRCKVFFSGKSLYCEYLRCLEALVAAPEPDAPPLMSGEAWQIKSCRTLLSGWAQLRHTCALQAKQNEMYFGGAESPSGFIEPVPEFFARMARLAERAGALLKQSGAFDIDLPSIAEDLRRGIIAQKKVEDEEKAIAKRLPAEGISVEDRTLAGKVSRVMKCLPTAGAREEGNGAHLREKVIELAQQLEQGPMPNDPNLVAALREMHPDLESRWQLLATLCLRLESLAHKQLRRVPFSREEDKFIEGYGTTLARVMFYDGNSYLDPNDDAPRVVDVFSNPNTGKFLEVGVARPHAFYVLYPVKGGEVLCRGAVLPYYEFSRGDRLTDAEWKLLLDSPARPRTPDWSRSGISRDDLSAPRQKAGG